MLRRTGVPAILAVLALANLALGAGLTVPDVSPAALGSAQAAPHDAPPAGLQQPPQVPGQNATNQTTIPGFGNGTNTHHHGNVGDQGLGAVWASVFHGVPEMAISADLNGDGVLDAIVGTDLGVTAVDGATGGLQWARHVGSTITSLFAFDADSRDGLEVGYSTLWEGQTPRVGVVDGATGDVQWEHIGARPYLTAAAATDAPGSDVVAIDIDGLHTRLSAVSGESVWEFDVDLLPDDATNGVAPDTAYENAGHYLAETGDLNGDGVTDTISVGNYFLGAGLNNYAIIHAVNGATGERLWITNVGGDPHVITQTQVYDIEALDTQGDGSVDLAYSFFVMRVDAILPTVVLTCETGWRVTKGDSNTVGVPIASRTIVTPEVQLESYPDLDHTDVDGDGRDELGTLHNLAVVNDLLGGMPLTYERFAMPLGSTGDPTLLAVSDVTVYADVDARITTFDRDGDGGRDHGIAWTAEGNATWTVVTAEGQVVGPYATGMLPVRAAAGLGGKVAVATRSALELRDAADLALVTSSMPLRGAPRTMQLADADADGTQDIYVLGSDGAVHIVDGVTGIGTRSIEVGVGASDFRVADLGRSDALDLIVAFLEPLAPQSSGVFAQGPVVRGFDGETGRLLYERVPDFSQYRAIDQDILWFDGDGDGTQDLLSAWYLGTDTLTATDGYNGRDLWSEVIEFSDNGFVNSWRHGTVVHMDGEGDDLALASDYGILVVDGDRGKQLGWHPIGGNGTDVPGRGPVTCLGGADGEGDGVQDLFAIHAGSVGDLARRLSIGRWEVLDWVPDESEVVVCGLQAVPHVTGAGEDLLVTMVWAEERGAGAVRALVGRYDPTAGDWVWRDIQTRPETEAQAYTALDARAGQDGRVFVAWQDHAYALHWSNGTLVGEFTVNGPFVVEGHAVDLDGKGPSEAIILAADGIVWALAEDRAGVASLLSRKATDEGKPSNYGPGSSFEAPPAPPEKPKKKSFIPASPLGAVAALAVAVAWSARRAERGNR